MTKRGPKVRKFTKSLGRKVVRLYNRPGGSISLVSQTTGLSRYYIICLLREAGVPLKGDGNKGRRVLKWPPQDVAPLWEQYHKGATLKEVGEGVGLSTERVRQIFVAAGYKTRGFTGPRPGHGNKPDRKRRALYVRLYQKGLSMREITQRHGGSTSSVTVALREAGIPSRNGDRPDSCASLVLGILTKESPLRFAEILRRLPDHFGPTNLGSALRVRLLPHGEVVKVRRGLYGLGGKEGKG